MLELMAVVQRVSLQPEAALLDSGMALLEEARGVLLFDVASPEHVQ